MHEDNKKRIVIKSLHNRAGCRVAAFRWGRYGCISSIGARSRSPLLRRMAGLDQPRAADLVDND
ncbi:MAG: hypothetical protein HKN19_07895 [Halioglobus sp.]|nr:hypothetical protein [Halioglobus sp.]